MLKFPLLLQKLKALRYTLRSKLHSKMKTVCSKQSKQIEGWRREVLILITDGK